jgi:hypothetical protein
MTIRQKLQKIAKDKNSPCITISFNTQATFDKSNHDDILLKNLLKDAKSKILDNYRDKELTNILQKINDIPSRIDMRFNSESLHIFISNETDEFIRSPWPVSENHVQVSDHFNLKPLIIRVNRTSEYLILLLSKGGTHLYQATNQIVSEITNEDFPIPETPFYTASNVEASNAKLVDDLAKEYLNRVDKAVQKVVSETNLACVVIATEKNYSELMQVADNGRLYIGFDAINYNDTSHQTIGMQGWEIMKVYQKKSRLNAVAEMEEAIGQARMITDLQEILRASEVGRGELLLVQQDFNLAVEMNKQSTSTPDDDSQTKDNSDIISEIAWNMFKNNGRIFFLEKDEMGNLGRIALKLRY